MLFAPDEARAEVLNQTYGMGPGLIGGLAWPGFLRKLDRQLPGYDA